METNQESNVISLNRDLPATTLANIEQSLLAAKANVAVYLNETTEFIMDQVVALFESMGIDVMSPRITQKEVLLLEMAIASIAHKFHGIHHVMQDIAEQCIQLTEDGIPLEDDDLPIDSDEDDDIAASFAED